MIGSRVSGQAIRWPLLMCCTYFFEYFIVQLRGLYFRMGEWLHCNVCCRLPNVRGEVAFFFTSCGHILCKICNTGQTGQCRVCGHWAKLLEINHKLPADVLLFFRDPKDLLEQYVKNVTAVLNFQSGHRNRLHNARQEQQCKAAKMIASARAEIKKKTDIEKAMAEERKTLQEELEKLRQQCRKLESIIDNYERGARQQIQTSTSARRNGCKERCVRSSLESSFIATSTPNSDCQKLHPNSAGRSTSLKHVAAVFAGGGIEPSPVIADHLLTTPDILGVKKSAPPERRHRRSGSGDAFYGEPFGFSIATLVGNFEFGLPIDDPKWDLFEECSC
uniref:RING-type domain-containing protein n=2 Tax=Ascaris TaxID=6251 RepID=A0A9J2PFS5_ASCLU